MKNCVKFFVIVLSVFAVVEMSAQEMNTNIKFRQCSEKQMRGVRMFNDIRVGHCYSSDINTSMNMFFEYELLTEKDYDESEFVIDREPFENEVIVESSPMRVGRGDTPDDPSVPMSIGNDVLPLLIFVMLWIVYKKN